MRTSLRRCVVLACGLLLAAVTSAGFAADSTEAKPDPAESRMQALKYQRQAVLDADADYYLHKVQHDKAFLDMETRGYEMDAIAKQGDVYWRYQNSRFNQDLYEAQLRIQPCIFVLVVLVVGAGVGFSYMQFTAERRRHRALMVLVQALAKLPPDSPLAEKALAEFDNISGGAQHSLEMGPIKLKSNVVGLIVLALSLAFFNIYIKQVYTITDQVPPAKTADSEN